MPRNQIVLVIILAVLLPACNGGVQAAATEQPSIPTPTQTATEIVTPVNPSVPTGTPTPWPAWYTHLDPSYNTLKYQYALVTNEQAKVYPSLKAASSNSINYALLPKNPAYVAILGGQTLDGNSFVELESGQWIAVNDLRIVKPSSFSGILLDRQVDFRFGWVLKDTESVDAQGVPVLRYSRYEIIREIPSRVLKAGYISVGDDEWLPEAALALTDANIPEDAGRYQCRFIHVDLTGQILRLYDGCQLIFATLVSTGENPAWTFPGWFFVNHKDEEAHLNSPQETISSYYLESVPYFMSYYGDLGLHGVYWHDDFGTPVSHGCINLSPADARWLYEWADIGELVIISTGD